MEIQKELRKQRKGQKLILKQKSREIWLKKGEKNSKLFLQVPWYDHNEVEFFHPRLVGVVNG